jgi:arylsulfatase A-like enzyme
MFHRMMSDGAWTFNARTEVEQTVTLPNHTSMLTSRRIDRTRGGHGVTWDDDRLRPRTVQAAAGHQVASVFSRLQGAGLSTAMFANKTKFSLYQRSWPAIDRSLILLDQRELRRQAGGDLSDTTRAFTFVHFAAPDLAGHASGWLSPAYLTAVRKTDRQIGRLFSVLFRDPEQRDHTLLVVTSDHGGEGTTHSTASAYADYRIPFLVMGGGVPAGVDLYDLNPTYADPGTTRPGYAAARQPIRNGDVGNLVLDVLGFPALNGSELDAAQDLEVTQP